MCGLGLNHHKSHTYGDLHSFEDKVLMLHRALKFYCYKLSLHIILF